MRAKPLSGCASENNTKKYHVFAPMGRFQLESIYLYFPPSSQLVYLCFSPVQDRNINILAGTTVENKGKLILSENNSMIRLGRRATP